MTAGRPKIYRPSTKVAVCAEAKPPHYRSLRKDVYEYVQKKGSVQLRYIESKWGKSGRSAVSHMLRAGILEVLS